MTSASCPIAEAPSATPAETSTVSRGPAAVSHQKQVHQDATNAIETKRKRRKLNEADRYSAAHNGPVAGSSPAGPTTFLVYRPERLFTYRRHSLRNPRAKSCRVVAKTSPQDRYSRRSSVHQFQGGSRAVAADGPCPRHVVRKYGNERTKKFFRTHAEKTANGRRCLREQGMSKAAA